MLHSRRNFISTLSLAAPAFSFSTFLKTDDGKKLIETLKHRQHPNVNASNLDEDFWAMIKQAYSVSPTILNLNNGGVSPQPRVVQEAVEHYNRLSNEAPSYYMWQIVDKGREPLRNDLARLSGADAEELAINRNSSEALETIIFGLQLQPGDEVVLTKQDYPNMINAWKQREQRDGIVLKWLNFEFPIEDKDQIVQTFENAFTDKTKVVHITHMINWNGQVLPAREIADRAKARGIDVLVDAAHSFVHIDFKIPDLNCDYLGTSLHKWLCAPFGSGLLYIRKEKIASLYPLLAAPNPLEDNIRKFEHLGTRSFAIEQGIAHAVDFHNMIGTERKSARLRYLKDYWTNAVKDLPGVTIGTPAHPAFSGAIALLQMEGKEPGEVSNRLFHDFKIHTVAINWENIHGVRITPNVYTLKSDLDRLIEAITAIAKS
ncbi:MAG: aminotransferase class V-fold PLP-dependent enzyme [Saprospiraceae bacterium]|nr:aminotransferase class V-fold PLP-dependent enzyme [Saprospiraceae bacterium]